MIINENINRESGAVVTFTDDTVIKQQDLKSSEKEYSNTRCGALIGFNSGLFTVPEILDHDLVHGTITFERLDGFKSLAQVLSECDKPEVVMSRIGCVLAAIHNNDAISNSGSTGGNEAYRSVIHGDFSTKNIFFVKKNIYIIDWSLAPWLKESSLEDSYRKYIDLSVMTLSLFLHRPFGPMYIKKPDDLMRIFLDSYADKHTSEFSLKMFKEKFNFIMREFLIDKRTFRSKLRIAAYYVSLIQARKSVRNI